MGLFNLIFTLGVNRKPMEKDLKAAEKTLNTFASNIKGYLAGAFTIGTVTSFAKSIHDTVNRIKDLSEQFGITTDEVQKTDYALKQSGMQFEDLSAAMSRLTNGRRDAVEGNLELRQSFEQMGISLADLNNPQVRAFDLLVKMSKAMAEGSVTGREQVMVMDLLGPKALKLSNVLGELSKIEPPKLIKPEDVKAIDDAAKAYERMATSAKALAAPVLSSEYNSIAAGLDALKSGDLAGAAKALNPFSRIYSAIKSLVPSKERDASTAEARAAEWVGPMPPEKLWEEDSGIKEKVARRAGFENFSISRPSDSLVSVGNFLGADPMSSMRTQVNQIQQRLMRIEQNTKRTADNAVIIRK